MTAGTKMQGQKTTLYWADLAALIVADIPAISLAHYATDVTANNVINYSDAVQSPYTLNPTDSDTDDTQMVGDQGNGKKRALYNYEAKFTFAREADPVTNTTSLFENAYVRFKKRGVRGYWGRRIGYSKATALAVGHKLRFFFVESFSPKTIDSDKGKPIWMEVNFGQQGYMSPVPTAVVA